MSNIYYSVSHETFSSYLELLEKWNNKINLVAKGEDVWNRHILDSTQLIKFIDSEDKIIDVGSGAGFPGVVLSLMGVKDVTLIESDVRKSAFLLQAAKLSPHKITVMNERVEKLKLECDILTCRAFASIDNILNLCQSIKVNKKLLLLKGQKAMMEIEEAKANWQFEYQMYENDHGWVVELKYDNSNCKSKRWGRQNHDGN